MTNYLSRGVKLSLEECNRPEAERLRLRTMPKKTHRKEATQRPQSEQSGIASHAHCAAKESNLRPTRHT